MMAGEAPAEWLNGCTLRAAFNPATNKIEVDLDDWHNLLAAAKIAYGIADEELAELNT